ncbi:MAG: hypothetical protein WAT71_16240 [Ignavibacteria bacterium]
MRIVLVSVLMIAVILSNRAYLSAILNDSNNSDSGIHVIIKPEFESYLLNQSVWIMIVIYNDSGKPYKLVQPIEGFAVRFDITDPNNDKISSLYGEHNYLEMDSVYLRENDSIKNFICLDYYMQSSRQLRNKQTGDYRIKAIYQGLESNTLIINVKYPIGDDEELFNQTYGAYYPISNDKQVVKLEGLLKTYNESPYCPQLYNWLLTATIDQKDTSRYFKNVQNFFDNNSNSFGTIFILDSYLAYLGTTLNLNPDQIDQRKSELKLKYNNTFIKKCLDNDNYRITKK